MLAGLTDWEQEKGFDVMNTITIQGNLTRDPKFSYSANGTPIINFSLADNGFANGEKTVIFWQCFMFGEQAERFGNEFMVGRQYTIKGVVVPNNYENDGVKHYGVKVHAECIKYDFKPKEK